MTRATDQIGAHAVAREPTTAIKPQTAADAVDMFVGGAVLARTVYAVVGPEGIAAVPSPHTPDRATYLFWSHHAEAERWADALVTSPRVAAIDLNGFLATTVPAIEAAGAMIGLDWSADPIEAEIAPVALAAHLREEAVRDFASMATRTRFVWVLAGPDGIAGIAGLDGGLLTPLWADRHVADAVARTLTAPGLDVTRKPLLELTTRYLLSPHGLKARLAPGYLHAPTPILMSPWALKALLNGSERPRTRLAAVS